MKLKIKRVHEYAKFPFYATPGSAGMDLSSVEDLVIYPGQRKLIKTGICIQLPYNTVGLICPRSGLAYREGVTILNAPGIIDSDYTGEVKVLLYNASSNWYRIEVGDRIAQLVIQPVMMTPAIEEVEALRDTERCDGGFGSTGYTSNVA